VGGLLAASRALSGTWEKGVTFTAGSCLAPQVWPYCPPDSPEPSTKTFYSPGDIVEFEPVAILQGMLCSGLGLTNADMGTDRDTASRLANETIDLTRDYALGAEFATGAITGNPSLADATPLAGVTSHTDAMAALEAAIAGSLYGRLGYIHVAPDDLVYLVAEDVVWRDGPRWRSPMGNVVVASAGYVSLSGTLYATPEVFAAAGFRENRAALDRATNTWEALAEESGLAVFDPCFNVSVAVSAT
jgi:hypothetical protein